MFTDTGYRFRRNSYQKQSNWLSFTDKQTTFYDIVHHNTDTFINTNPNFNQIAEMYFRINTDSLHH